MSSGAQNYRVVIKIGSSSLTSVHGEISRKKLERLVDEIVRLKDDGHEVLLVSSGAVAAGYRKLGCLTRPDSLPEKQAAASIGQGLLIESYSDLFLSHGYVASQILITRSDFLDEHRYNNARNTINVLLERGIIPIVNENDTITIDRLNFGDNDTLSAKVAGLVDADKLIILSDIEGLYDSDPRKNKNATLVERVTEITQEIEAAAGDPGSAVGTGGMKSKINAFKIAMASGIHSFLGKASTPNIIYDAVYHKAVGTYFEYSSNMISLNQKKKWLAFNSGPEGEVVVSKSGKDVMVEEMKDITQTQILQVKGQFSKGVVVRIRDEHGFEIGLGIINYSSEELVIMKEHEYENELSVINKDDFVCHLDIEIPVGV